MSRFRSALYHFRGKIWFAIHIFFTVVYLAWRTFFTIALEYGVISIISGVALLVVEILGMAEAFVHYANMYSVESYAVPEVPSERMPDVDVFIATYSEEPALLHKTINGCLYMDYPNKSKVHIYLCDDNRRQEMRELAAKMGVNYLDRPDNRGAKAGNLNHAMACSHSPYIVTLDADMIPKHDFLMKTMPYFVDAQMRNEGRDEADQIRLGFLQTPQSFYNPDLFQFNLFSESRIPNEQDYFYKDIQVARTKTNSVIYGGSNTVLSRAALQDVGGFYTDAITEDFATGILIESEGYVSLATSEVLASGLSAGSLQNLIQQRIRWARGVIATGRRLHIYTSRKLSFAQKMNYWASIWYWYAPLKRLIYIMSPILYATFGFMVFKCTLPQILLFWLPMYISSSISLRMLSGNIRNTKWTGVYETIMFPFLLVPILLETVGISLKKFKVTEKDAPKSQKGRNPIFSAAFLILIVLSVIGIVNCILTMFDSGSFRPIVVLFWLLNNLFFLVMSMMFVDGRIHYRKSERVRDAIACTVHSDTQLLPGITRDFSETGISVNLEAPYYLEPESMVRVSLQYNGGRANLGGFLVYVAQREGKWNYAFAIKDYGDTYDSYLQMIHDRVPVLPKTIKKHSGMFEDLKLNTTKRVETPFFQKRKYARILLNTQLPCKETDVPVSVVDFNYAFVSLSGEALPETLTLLIGNDISLCCTKTQRKNALGRDIYGVTNLAALMADSAARDALVNWLMKNHSQSEQVPRQEHLKKQKKEEFNESSLV